MNLDEKINKAGGVYKYFAPRLERLGIRTFRDFVFHIPSRYEDFSLFSKAGRAQEGETVTILGTVEDITSRYTKTRKTIQKAKIRDETGIIEAIWFNQPFLTKIIQKGDSVSLSGKVQRINGVNSLKSPLYEVFKDKEKGNLLHTGRLTPLYPETKRVSSRWLREQVAKILKSHTFEDYLPEEIKERNNLPDLHTALLRVHFPRSIDQAISAKRRLAFDELFFLQLKAILRRKDWEKNLKGIRFDIKSRQEEFDKFKKSLKFSLTNSQREAIKEILADLTKSRPMNRLLQGEVGSGKTVVAAAAIYAAHLNGYKSVFMAPTEILANQHYYTILELLGPLGTKIKLITSSTSRKKSENQDDYDVLIGTHSLLFEEVDKKSIGLVVIDEQQRFGVTQRSIIRQKGENPHFLTMTATPIPRTVALTMYGDLDLSYLQEMPKGRKKIKTWLVPSEKRDGAYRWIEKEIKSNNTQAFIICPFIEESETITTARAAKAEFERLKKDVFKNLRLALLHGKMKNSQKEKVMNDFKEGKAHILVSTPVVEVGIDIPNASIIMIEAAERFGLSQLHQLRGRVGRGEKQSYCLLFTEAKSENTIKRLKALERLQNGAQLAELDLKLRGPGEIYGTLQHGVPSFKYASFSDFGLIEIAKKEAERIYSRLHEFPMLEKKLREMDGLSSAD